MGIREQGPDMGKFRSGASRKVPPPQRVMAIPVLLWLVYFRHNGPYEANTNYL